MGLNEVKNKILKDLDDKKQAIVKESKTEEDLIAQATNKEIAEYKDTVQSETKELLMSLELQEIAATNLETSKRKLHAKKEILDKVYQLVETKIKNLELKKRINLCNKLVGRASKVIDVDNIYCNKKDVGSLSNAKEVEINGGVICENKNGTHRVDYSFETIFEQAKEESIGKLADILFN